MIFRQLSPNSYAAGFFAEEVRRELAERYGSKKLYEGGLSVRSTLDPKLQISARKALSDGLVRFDEARGWRGAHGKDRRRRATGVSSSAEVADTDRRRSVAARRGAVEVRMLRRRSVLQPAS